MTGFVIHGRRQGALVAAAALAALGPGGARAGPGDGRVFYGVSGNTNPQTRTYNGATNTFSAAANTVAGATPLVAKVVSSPARPEALAGYVDATGNLRVLVWNGSTWSGTAWGTVAVGGTGVNGRRFDIAYENLSGDAVVLYSRNVTGTNELAYRVWNGTSFAAATNLDSARLTGTALWVKMAARPGSDEIAAIVSDSASDLTALVWNGTAWGSEPSAALSTTLETVAAAGDVDCFDLAYESLSSDLLVVWADSTGANGTNGVRYATRSAAGTWSAAQTPGTFLDDATNLALCSDPGSDHVLFGSIGNAGSDYQHGAWAGTAWVNNAANVDTAAALPAAGSHMVACAWLTAGATTRGVITYADAANTAIDYYTYAPGVGFTAGTDFAYTGTSGTDFQIQMSRDPSNSDRLMLVMGDSNADLYAKRLVMDATPTFTWSNADGNVALTATLPGITAQAFGFAYDRPGTTVADGANPGNASVCPGGAATMLDAFTLQTNGGSDGVTSATVSLPAGTATGLSLVEISDDAGSAVYGSVANPATDTVTVAFPVAATTTITQYKVRVTPKAHADMPAPPGSSYAVTGRVTAIASGAAYAKFYRDSGSATVTVDNASPADPTWGAITPGNGQVVLNWTNPADADFAQVLVLRKAAGAPTEVPAEGQTYTAPGTLGASAVIYAGILQTFTDANLGNGTDYHYRIFARDGCGNWSAVGPVLGPVRPSTVFLTVNGAGQPAGGNIQAGTVRSYVGNLALAATSGTVTLTGLGISNNLTGAGAAEAGVDVSSLQLFEDVTGNGLTADDKLLGTLSPSGGGAYVSTGLSYNGLPGYDVPVSPGKTVAVGLNAAPGARAGRQFAMKVTRGDLAVQVPAGVGTITPEPVVGSTFSFTAGTLDNSTNAAFPMAVIVNPVDGRSVTSYAPTDPGTAAYPGFRVQVQIASTTALTSVVVNYSGTASGSVTLARNASYGGTANSGIWETSGPVHLRLAPGAYVLQAVATNGSGSTGSTKAIVNVVGQRGVAGGVSGGDGSILVRDNSSQLCSDCHALASHSSQVVGTKYGAWGTGCRDCHTPHSTRNIYLVRESISPPNVQTFQGAKPVYFSTTTGDSGVAGATNKPQASFANADNTGPCQVCHTRTSPLGAPATARWRNTGNADTHFTAAGGTETCTGCHNHSDGFKAFESTGGATDPVKYGRCSSCHGAIWNAMNGTTAKASRHPIGNVAGTNDSYLDSGLAWASPLSGSAAASRSCVNMCHQDHVHNQPAGTSHSYNVHQDATSTASRQVTRDVSGNITAGTPATTDFDNTPANGGMCLSCHRNPINAGGPVIDKAGYNASAHNYTNFSTYGAWTYTQHDTTLFSRNCTKCHADRNDTRPNDGGTPFGAVHYSDFAHLLAGTMQPGTGGLDVPANLVCYNCHGNGTTGSNLSGKDIATQVAKASGHPANVNGALDQAAIQAASAFGNSLGGGGRHAGCSDCHDPHLARPGGHGYTTGTATFTSGSATVTGQGTNWTGFYAGARIKPDAQATWFTVSAVATPTQLTLTANFTGTTATAAAYTMVRLTNLAGPALEGAWGAQLSTNPAFWTAPTSASFTKKTMVSGTDLEATLCFKCHSSYYGTLPTSPSGGYTETDTAREFNPNNVGNFAGTWASGETAGGFHPVLATAGSNLGAITLANLVTTNFPWSTTARNLMTCTDCHESDSAADPNGPHGSTAGFILRGPNTAWNNTLVATTTSMPAGVFCANCHSTTWANSRFPSSDSHFSRSQHRVACMNCHARIPHGGPRPGILVAPAGAAAGVGGIVAGWDQTAPYSNPGTGNRLYIASYPTNNTSTWSQNNCGCNGTGH